MEQKQETPQVQQMKFPVCPPNQEPQTNLNQKQIDKSVIRIINRWSETANHYFAAQHQTPRY